MACGTSAPNFLHMPAIPTATEEDVWEFRRIRSQQNRSVQNLRDMRCTRLKRTLIQINRALGRPWRLRWSIQHAVRQSVHGTSRHGTAVSAQYGIGIVTQFRQIFAEALCRGTLAEEYYLHQLYLTERWRLRMQQYATSQAARRNNF